MRIPVAGFDQRLMNLLMERWKNSEKNVLRPKNWTPK
jgi:hypothetical protein